jgi:fumarylacetoacetate (FAA) hydrolase
MKFATLKTENRDGELLLVSRDNQRATSARHIAPTLQYALDHWAQKAPLLQALYEQVNQADWPLSFRFNPEIVASPLPRAYAWIDGSAYINHVVLVRKARGASPPPTLETDPLMYQGGSDAFLAPYDDITLMDESWGCDFESEIAVVTGDVPQGVAVEDAWRHIRLILLCNDVSLRNLIPGELAKGFGFVQSKPSSTFSPIAITPDELGSDWRDGRVYLPLTTKLNGALFGQPDAGSEMHFSFYDLIAHAAKSRPLRAGTLIGSGTVSNHDVSKGSSCLAERRMLETINQGAPETPFLKYGDRVTIEMFQNGQSVFGKIEQAVKPHLTQPQRSAYDTFAA